jgi:hypothetical protein
MNGEVDPYVPPAVDPTRPLLESRDAGKLWQVVDGGLRVRNMASLPDVCIYGAPVEEPGTRVSLVLQTLPHWPGQLLWWLAVAMMLRGNVPLGWSFVLICLAIVLSNFLGKRVRIMTFQSRRAARMSMFRGVLFPVVMGVAIYAALDYDIRWGWVPAGIRDEVGVGLVLLVGILFSLLPVKGPARAVSLKDGWFEVKGAAPEAVQRLAEIQQRADPAHRPA